MFTYVYTRAASSTRFPAKTSVRARRGGGKHSDERPREVGQRSETEKLSKTTSINTMILLHRGLCGSTRWHQRMTCAVCMVSHHVKRALSVSTVQLIWEAGLTAVHGLERTIQLLRSQKDNIVHFLDWIAVSTSIY